MLSANPGRSPRHRAPRPWRALLRLLLRRLARRLHIRRHPPAATMINKVRTVHLR